MTSTVVASKERQPLHDPSSPAFSPHPLSGWRPSPQPRSSTTPNMHSATTSAPTTSSVLIGPTPSIRSSVAPLLKKPERRSGRGTANGAESVFRSGASVAGRSCQEAP